MTQQGFRLSRIRQAILWAGLLGFPALVQAQTVDIEQRQREQLEQQRAQQIQQQEQRASQLNKPPTEPLPPQTQPTNPTNDTCFPIRQIHWNQGDIEPPRYLRYQAQAAIIDEYSRPQCMNQAQLVALQKNLNNSLIEHGHITSKVNFPSQNLTAGVLNIDWYPGVVSKVTYDASKGKPIGSLSTLYPWQEGRLYNQRHADQALENLKRLGSQGNASIDLKPGAQSGSSELQYSIEPQPYYKRIHGSIGIDNSGSDSTGQYQGNASLTIDSPLYLNDQLTLNYNRNTDVAADQHNTKSLGAYWDVNFGYLNLNLGYTRSTYLRTEPGLNTPEVITEDTALEGKSQDYYIGLGYMLYRNSHSKLQLTSKLGRKSSHTYYNQTENPYQMRDYVYVDSGLNYTLYRKDQQYTLSANLRQNLPQHSKALGEIYGYPNWDGKWRVYTVNATANIPFTLKEHAFKYNSSLKLQHGERPLPASEYLSIGSRYSVRGFDETFSLSAEDGLVWRNELAYLYGANHAQQIYLGLDYGVIHGPATEEAAGNSLAGAALGVRGSWHGIGYDLALAVPLHKPTYLKTDSPAFYGSLNWSF